MYKCGLFPAASVGSADGFPICYFFNQAAIPHVMTKFVELRCLTLYLQFSGFHFFGGLLDRRINKIGKLIRGVASYDAVAPGLCLYLTFF